MRTIAIIVISLGLVYLLARLFLLKGGKDGEGGENEGIHGRRIGDGLRRLETMKAKYAQLTPELLQETPDEELIEAVLSNLWAKMRPDLSDAYDVIATLSPERQHIFVLYAVTGGVKQEGFEKLKASPDGTLLPKAEDALAALSMPDSASILKEAIQAEEADAYSTPYLDAFNGEGGKEQMVQFIRSHISEFTD